MKREIDSQKKTNATLKNKIQKLHSHKSIIKTHENTLQQLDEKIKSLIQAKEEQKLIFENQKGLHELEL